VTGFIAKDPINNAIIISFRGTHSKDDIATDVNYHLVPARSICLRCEASHGFWRAWSDVKDGVLGTLGGDKKRKIVVTGHSLGGALASIAAADLRGIGYVVDMVKFDSSSSFYMSCFVALLLTTPL
jgi:putative lipase involved disintegration of autophagic bodies